jgi:hypothetical protein
MCAFFLKQLFKSQWQQGLEEFRFGANDESYELHRPRPSSYVNYPSLKSQPLGSHLFLRKKNIEVK